MIFTEKPLFGGAVTMQLLEGFIDVSDLRQVPDTQEVFLSPNSDVSLILEILQRVNEQDGQEAVKFHFNALADDNSAESHQIHEIVMPSSLPLGPSDTPAPITLCGEQKIRKFNHSVPDEVLIFIALYRVDVKGIDLLLTVNAPSSVQGTGNFDRTELEMTAKRIFNKAAKSLRINNFGLFV